MSAGAPAGGALSDAAVAALVGALDAGETHLLGEEMRSAVLHRGRRARRVVVLLHGLTASPRTWRAFARARFERGENVLIARLPRHGYADRMTTALLELTADELRAQGGRILDAAQVLGDEIVLVGHSLGGALALHLAHADARVYRAIAIAPFLGIKRLPRGWHAFARAALDRAPARFVSWNPLDPAGARSPAHGYPRYSTRSLAVGLALADALRADAHDRVPRATHVEIVRNAGETSVSNGAIDDLVARWRRAGGAHVHVHRLIGLERSHDVVEPERARRGAAARFLPHLHALLDDAPPTEDRVIDARG